ncbi:MAG: cysteine hydrolase [Ilumatobacteraceae bacterium]
MPSKPLSPHLVDPGRCAVITMELQRGVCGDLATMTSLAEAVTSAGVVPATAGVLAAARRRAVPIVHCTFTLLDDRAGTPMNAPLMRMVVKDPNHLLVGSTAADVIPELGLDPGDVISDRHHGFAPFTGTDLATLLHNRDVGTVIVTGVSLNLGIPGAVIEAVGCGFDVVLLSDCVVGVPGDYGDAIIANTLAMVATITDSQQLIAAWE